MNEWYLVYGFCCKPDLNDYKEELALRKNQTGSMNTDDLGGINLGVYFLDLERIEDFYLSEEPRVLRDYAYYVFWKLGAGFSTGYGFYDKKDM